MTSTMPLALPGVIPEAPRGRDALRHPVLWFRANPYVADALLAAVFAALPALMWVVGPENAKQADYRAPDVGLGVVIVLTSAPLIWRRRSPLAVLGVTLLASTLMGIRQYDPGHLLFGDLVALYTVAAHSSRRASRRVIVAYALLLGPLMLAAPTPPGGESTLGDVGVTYLIYGAVWLTGDNLKTRRANVLALHDRAERAERERTLELERAAEAERNRIARELHDVVAHSMSVMVVQASGARRVIGREPDRAEAALEMIEATGREALSEMRRLLGVLRDGEDGDGGARAPQPSLARVDDLVAESVAAGVPVDLALHGEPRPLPAGVDLAAYRIVQEALTNVLRHAGPARADITLTWGDDDLQVEIVDDGRGLSADRPDPDQGHGLVGIRERAALYGGSVDAGPRPGGGFAVRARLPLGSPS